MLGHVRPPLWTGVGSGTSSGTPKNFSAFRSGEDKKISVCLTDSLKEEMCAKTRIFGRFQGPQIIFARRSRGVGHTHSFNNLPLPGGGEGSTTVALLSPVFIFFEKLVFLFHFWFPWPSCSPANVCVLCGKWVPVSGFEKLIIFRRPRSISSPSVKSAV